MNTNKTTEKFVCIRVHSWPKTVFALLALPLWGQDPASIVRRSVQRDASNFERIQNYTFVERNEEREFGRDGKLKSTDIETYEILILGGRPYGRLIERKDQPLSLKDQRKEQEKLDKEAAKRQSESAADKAREEKKRLEQRKFMRELPDAFNFTLAGVEQVSGLPAWVIEAQPKPGYRAVESRAKLFAKVRGKIWIDQTDYQWVKAEAEIISTLSFGLGLLRIAPGGRLAFEQVRVNDEVWLPLRIAARGEARLGYVKKLRADLDVTYKDYKKFQSDSRIVEVTEK